MKKGNAFIAAATAAGIAGIAYAMWPKKKIPASAIVDPLISEKNVI